MFRGDENVKIEQRVHAYLEINAREPSIVTLKCPYARACRDIPEYHRAIPTCTDDFPVLQADSIDGPLVTLKGLCKLQSLTIPYTD